MPDTHATTPPHRFQVRADHMLTWLANATDSIGQPFHETYGLNDTFRPGVDDLHNRIQILVSQAHTDGVLTVPGHHLELWQVSDEGFLLTLDPPDGPRLCSQHLSIADLMPNKTAGSVAAFAVLDATTNAANELLDERDHGAGRTATPSALSCAADPRRVRDWLASPSTDARLATGSVTDVWDFGATFATEPAHHAVNLVEQAQQAGVFGIPGHHIALLHVPSDEHPDQDGFLLTIDTPTRTAAVLGLAAPQRHRRPRPRRPGRRHRLPDHPRHHSRHGPHPDPTRDRPQRPGRATVAGSRRLPPARHHRRHEPATATRAGTRRRHTGPVDPPPLTTVHAAGEPAMTATTPPAPVPPAWGWRSPGAGRAAHVATTTEYQGTTTQLCGLFPFVAGSGAPAIGIPIGRHMLWGQVVCLDPLEWLRAGLVSNPGVFVLGQPGAGKSALVKRLVTGLAACGTRILILGDTKPDYTPLVHYLGGQTIYIGRGLDRINPLDTGPLGTALRRMSGERARQLRLELRGRRMALLLALCSLVRGRPLSNGEEIILGRAIDIATEHSTMDPTIPDVLTLIEAGTGELHAAARARTEGEYRRRVDDLIPTLALLCEGSLAGVFDGPTTTPIDLTAPAVSVDISRVAAAGDQLVTAAMLCVWAYGYGLVDAHATLAHDGAPRHHYLAVMDELWRALRGAPGLVEHADSLTRLNRAKGIASVMVTHSLADLDALPTPEDRAKAQGFIERSAIKVLAGLPPRELDRVGQVVRLGIAERELVSSWAAPEAWLPGARHPGRGKYLIKTGDRPGLPVSMTLVGDEHALYDTDGATRVAS